MAISYLLYKNARSVDQASAKENIEEVISEKNENAKEILKLFDFGSLTQDKFRFIHNKYQNLWEQEGVFVGAFINGELKYWSDNKVPILNSDTLLQSEVKIAKLDNGWYLVNRERKDSIDLYALSLIKTEYLYENKYLESRFHEDFSFPYESTITTDSEASGILIDHDGEYLFTVIVDKEAVQENPQTSPKLAILFALGLLFITLFLFRWSMELLREKKILLAIVIFVIPVLLFRAWTDYDLSPSVLYDLELFSPELYAHSSWLPSLGDFLLNIYTIFVIAYFFYRTLKLQEDLNIKPVFIKYLIVVLGILGLFFISFRINVLLEGIVINSKINFGISNLFDLNAYSFIGIGVVGLLMFTYFLLCNILVLYANRSKIRLNLYYAIFTIAVFVHFVQSLVFAEFDLLEVTWPTLILFIAGLMGLKTDRKYTFTPVVGLLIINSLFAAHVIIKYSEQKEVNTRLIYAEHKLANDENLDTEIRFAQLEVNLLDSDVLQMPFDTNEVFDKAQFDHRLKTEFFTGHWDQYEISFSLFQKDSLPLGFYTSTPKDYEELSDIKTRSGMPSFHSKNIFYIPNYDNKLSYLIHLTIPGDNAEPRGHLFAELKSKKLPKDIGFPELLLDKKNRAIDALAGYSFARYMDSSLVFKLGPYNYSIYDHKIRSMLKSEEDTHVFYDENGYNHLVYKAGKNNFIVLGKPNMSFLEKITTFSYLFALFSILVLLSVSIKEIQRIKDIRRLSLKNKIQFVLIGLILASLILFGLGTRYFISRQYNEKNNKLISEKIKSVNIEVKKKLGKFDELYDDLSYVNTRLHKFSLVFFTDISFYDTDGSLLATSRHEMFNSGLLGRKMHPDAFIELSENRRSEYVQEERVGDMYYLSAYVPFVNDEGKILGYLNLPYFAKQNPLENEISNFLVAIINIFVVLFALSIVAALFVSNWVTKPLKFLQTSVSSIELGKDNAKIEYSGQDEIGDLVQEYNKKVADLEDAANQLARTERESAWRDMAKQVAHEIKNPLTPMKLSVQHFQRSFDKDDPNAKERIERFAGTLIEQIETLTTIADEFSNFAKMPVAQMEEVDLNKLLSHCVELFKETDSTEVVFTSSLGESKVYYDREHLVRIFNNLIKNALQAIPHSREGLIIVNLDQTTTDYVVKVTDNGTGIPKDKLDKIFVPNFTTKSKGMGLGLSMVKSMVENAKGDVWFETKEDVGTTFFVRLPKIE